MHSFSKHTTDLYVSAIISPDGKVFIRDINGEYTTDAGKAQLYSSWAIALEDAQSEAKAGYGATWYTLRHLLATNQLPHLPTPNLYV